MFQDFHFLRPEWLWLLIPLMLLLYFMYRFSRQSSGWQQVIAPHLMTTMMPESTHSRRRNVMLGLIGIPATLSIVAGAGPTIERLPQPVFSVSQGHVVVMDMSLSMRSTDVTPDRLTRAKFKAIDLIKGINEGEMGLVAYAGDAFVISPLTEDIATLETLLPSLRPEIMPVSGSDALLGLQLASDLLLQAGYPTGKLYWITDGIESNDVQEIRKWLSTTQLSVNILAVGTKDGAPIRQVSGELLKDSRGNIVIPQLNVNRLLPLASQTGGALSTLSADDSDIQKLISTDLTLETDKSEQENQLLNGDQWFELGPYLVVLVLPFVLYCFRRGVVAMIAISIAYPFVLPSQAEAKPGWTNWFKNADQQGLEAYNEQAYLDAANAFNDPVWKGSAHYKEGNYEAALEAFSQVDSANGWYNRGNALAKMQKLDDAIAAYEEALLRQPEFTQAAENKALLEMLKEQQEQQENQDQGEQNQQDNNQQQDSDNQSDQNQQSQDNNQQQNQQQGDQNDEQQQSSPPENEQQSADDQQQAEEQESEQEQQAEAQQEDGDENETDQAQQSQMTEAQMTDEEREKQQQMEALLRRIPNDPAYLLQRKMQLEAQQRNRQRMPVNQEKTW